MTPEEFRTHGHALVEWVADYLETVGERPVAPPTQPGDVRALLPAHPPEEPEPFTDVIADLDRVVTPHLLHWQHPSFFGFFPANTSGPSILADLVSSGLGVQGMLWATSPACTELETHVLDWMAELLGLPDRFRSSGPGGGVIQDSASSATLVSVLAARHRASAAADAATTVAPHQMVAYATDQAHSSIEKAVRIAALGTLRRVPTHDDHTMDPDALARLVSADRAAGLVPTWVCATVGTTSSLAVDPVRAIAAAAPGAWLHVDAAMAGMAAMCPEHRWLNDGIELADSWVSNAHKWLGVGFDCSCCYVADRRPLVEALSVLPSYLRNAASESGAVIDYRDWQVPLGRRFRSLKLWFVLRSEGAEALRTMMRRHIAMAASFAEQVAADPRLELAAPPVLDLVCFRHTEGDAATRALAEQINATGRAYLTSTELDGRPVIRVSIGSRLTEQAHLDELWSVVDALA